MKHVAKCGIHFYYDVELSYGNNIVIVREAIEVDNLESKKEML